MSRNDDDGAMRTSDRRWRRRLACGAAAVLALSACSSDGDGDDVGDDAGDDADSGVDAAEPSVPATGDEDAGAGPDAGDDDGDTVDATIIDFSFDPDPIEVSAGTAITWTNDDGATHTVTSVGDVAFDSGDLASGESFTLTVDEPGEITYVCMIHGQMSGTIVSG